MPLRQAISQRKWCPAMDDKVLDSIVAQVPVGRLGEAEEIGRCVAFLCDENSGFITGAVLSANGGQYIAA